MVVSNSSSVNDERGNLEQTRSTLLRELAKHFLSRLDHLPLPLLGRFLIETAAFDFGEDASLFALALETAQRLFKGLVVSNVDSCRHWRTHLLSVRFAQPSRDGARIRTIRLPPSRRTVKTTSDPPVEWGFLADRRSKAARISVSAVDQLSETTA
jgi:hypothetical protein